MTNKVLLYAIGGANARIIYMEVDLARFWSMKIELPTMKATLSFRDVHITSLE